MKETGGIIMPTTGGSDFLSPDEAKDIAGIVKNTCQMAMFVTADQARAAVNQIEREGAIMPILDPTRFMAESSALHTNVRMLKAFRDFRLALEKIRQDLEE